MSDPTKKPGRFGSTFKNVAAPSAPPAPEPTMPEAPQPAPQRPSEADPEPYSTYLTRRTKKLLRQATVEEGRKQFEIVEQAIVAYIEQHHPGLIRK